MKAMKKAYDKNRTQMFEHINDLEIQAKELTNFRQRLNVKKMGNISHFDKDLDDMFDSFSKSGRLTKKVSGDLNKESKNESEKSTPRG